MWAKDRLVRNLRHIRKNRLAIAQEGRQEPRFYGKIPNNPQAIRKLIKKVCPGDEKMFFCYEAGPCGYEVYRLLTAVGQNCLVVAPSLIPIKAGVRIKTDRRDVAGNFELLFRGFWEFASRGAVLVSQLQNRVLSLGRRREETMITAKAAAKSEPALEPTAEPVATFLLLQRELTGNVDCLFVFVEHPEVEPTNNRSERNDAARSSPYWPVGKRGSQMSRSPTVLAKIDRWLETGHAMFQQELQAVHADLPPPTSARGTRFRPP